MIHHDRLFILADPYHRLSLGERIQRKFLAWKKLSTDSVWLLMPEPMFALSKASKRLSF
jgi:hypothetical protein